MHMLRMFSVGTGYVADVIMECARCTVSYTFAIPCSGRTNRYRVLPPSRKLFCMWSFQVADLIVFRVFRARNSTETRDLLLKL